MMSLQCKMKLFGIGLAMWPCPGFIMPRFQACVPQWHHQYPAMRTEKLVYPMCSCIHVFTFSGNTQEEFDVSAYLWCTVSAAYFRSVPPIADAWVGDPGHSTDGALRDDQHWTGDGI